MLDEVPVSSRRIIAREWLIFVACLLGSLVIAGAIAWHARDAAKADALAAVDAVFASPQQPEPPPSLLNRAGQLPFRKVSTALLLLFYVTVSLVRSVFWAVRALRQPVAHGSPGEEPAARD
ncbi:MAG TPA: hypothetical protein VHG32_00850 [Thermoanaerobaculia bacterium]|jgi:hypothetical protein|nr:hypothetical protein [Thermoanaerobaculia bacterium]